jgi:hypothetical protein
MEAAELVYEISFDVDDDVSEAEAATLVAELARLGDHGEITERYVGLGAFADVVPAVVLITTGTVSGAGLSAVTAFLYRVFQKGVVVDLTGDLPQITKSGDLPRGTLLIRWHDGREELRRDMTDGQIVAAMQSAISALTTGSSAPDPGAGVE